MAIEAYDLIQEDALTQLTRAELQALGKVRVVEYPSSLHVISYSSSVFTHVPLVPQAHNVKANLKSATIISQLLKKFPDGVPNPKCVITQTTSHLLN